MDECEGVRVCMRESACAWMRRRGGEEEEQEEEEDRRRNGKGEEKSKGSGWDGRERAKFNVFSSLRWPLGPLVLFRYQSQARDSSHAKRSLTGPGLAPRPFCPMRLQEIAPTQNFKVTTPTV